MTINKLVALCLFPIAAVSALLSGIASTRLVVAGDWQAAILALAPLACAAVTFDSARRMLERGKAK